MVKSTEATAVAEDPATEKAPTTETAPTTEAAPAEKKVYPEKRKQPFFKNKIKTQKPKGKVQAAPAKSVPAAKGAAATKGTPVARVAPAAKGVSAGAAVAGVKPKKAKKLNADGQPKKQRHNKNDRVYHLLKLLASKSQVQRYLDIGCGVNCTTTDQVALKLKIKESFGLDTIELDDVKRPKSVQQVVNMTDNHTVMLDFPTGSLDLVTCYASLHHFSSDELPLLLRDIRRVLRHGGYLFIREIDGLTKCSCPADIRTIEAAVVKKPPQKARVAKPTETKDPVKTDEFNNADGDVQESKEKAETQQDSEMTDKEEDAAGELDQKSQPTTKNALNEDKEEKEDSLPVEISDAQMEAPEDVSPVEVSTEVPAEVPVEVPAQTKAEEKPKEMCPEGSIHGNSTFFSLSREALKNILCKRLQFTHLGDSTAPPTNQGQSKENDAVYHSLFQKGPEKPTEHKRNKMELKDAFRREDGQRQELWRNATPEAAIPDEAELDAKAAKKARIKAHKQARKEAELQAALQQKAYEEAEQKANGEMDEEMAEEQ